MERNLLILGAGVYSSVAKEVAQSMQCFDLISFVDDKATETALGDSVIGDTKNLSKYRSDYSEVFVAIGNREIRAQLLKKVIDAGFNLVTLVSPKAYLSPSAKIFPGCIIEPMAVVHSGCVIKDGSFISAGAVVNHYAQVGECSHIDCNATVVGNVSVPCCTKVFSGEVFKG